MQALLTWAYDGSGVALRVPVTIKAIDGDVAKIKVETTDTEIQYALSSTYAPTFWVEDTAVITVPEADLSPVGSPPHLASFNWLD